MKELIHFHCIYHANHYINAERGTPLSEIPDSNKILPKVG